MADEMYKEACAQLGEKDQEIERLKKELTTALQECEEQARLNGMGAQREARLMTLLKERDTKYQEAEQRTVKYRAERDRALDALKEIKAVSSKWANGQNTLIRTDLLIIDGIADRAIKGGG